MHRNRYIRFLHFKNNKNLLKQLSDVKEKKWQKRNCEQIEFGNYQQN